MSEADLHDRIRGVLLGTAAGDAVGLPAEGISRRRIARLFPRPWRHRLLWRYGMLSDDTEQTLFVAQALLAHPDSSQRFARHLAWSLRWWLLGLPAGIGLATGRAIFRLWLGFSPQRSGVFSAGNGAAMRVAPIGVRYYDDTQRMQEFVTAASRITHSDPRATTGAMAVASVCAWALRDELNEPPALERYIALLRECGSGDTEWQALVDGLHEGLQSRWTVQQYAERLEQQRGISGYVYRTVPVALFAWYRHYGDFEEILSSLFDCGGDTDTVGAIAGAMAGAVVGEAGIPAAWLEGIADWPRGTHQLRQAADRLATLTERGTSPGTVALFWPAVLPRNLFFLVIVLLHGLRRLLPPY